MTPQPRSPRSLFSTPAAAASVAVAVLATLGGALAADANARPVGDAAQSAVGFAQGAGSDVARLAFALRSAPRTAQPSPRATAPGALEPAAAPQSDTRTDNAPAKAPSAADAPAAQPSREAGTPSAGPASTAPAAAPSSAPSSASAVPKPAAPSAPAAAPTTAAPAPAQQSAALVLNIARSGASQSLIDACQGPVLWGAGGAYPSAGLVGQHNYCGGGAFMGLHVGDIVQVNGLSAGTYRVASTMVIPGRSNAYAGQFGNADMALQTCTWDNKSYFYALLVRA